MAYADLLDDEGIPSQYLIKIEARHILHYADLTFAEGVPSNIFDTYSTTWTLGGKILRIELDPNTAALTEQSGTSFDNTTDGFFLDSSTNTLSFCLFDVNNYGFCAVVYEIYFSTYDAKFYSDPLDNTSEIVYWEPLISSAPSITQNSGDDLFGFLPTTSGNVRISNATQYLQENLYKTSFNKAPIKVYHWLDELTVDNTKLVFDGLCSNVSYKDNEITIGVFDNRLLFDDQYQHVAGEQYYTTADFAGLDPDYEETPVRNVYGVVDKFIPTNIDFDVDAPSGTNNRDWSCINPHDNLGSVTATVSSSPSSTTTRTYVDNADGLRVGDSVWIDKATDEYVEITAVNKTGSHYIEHAALSSGAAAASDTVTRSFIGSVTIQRSGFPSLKLFYKRDYDEYTDATDKVAGFTLNDNFENSYNGAGEMFENTGTNPTTLVPGSDGIYCRVYGHTNQETISAAAFGSDSANTGSLAQGIVILYSILKNHLGIDESDIDTTTFSTLQGSNTDELGFAVPLHDGEDFPSYRELLALIMQSLLLRFHINDDGKYSISQIGPLSSSSKTVTNDEIMLRSLEYDFDYKDIISGVTVKYAPADINAKGQAGNSYTRTSFRDIRYGPTCYLVNKQAIYESLHFDATEAATYAERLYYVFGDRRGTFRLRTKQRLFDTELNDVLTISRERLPGFQYTSGTDRTRDGAVLGTSKSLTEINIELDDQFGIEQNSGSW